MGMSELDMPMPNVVLPMEAIFGDILYGGSFDARILAPGVSIGPGIYTCSRDNTFDL